MTDTETITTGPDYGSEAQQLRALADELMSARNELLRAYGTPGYEDVKQQFIDLLWDERMTIIFALRRAAETSDLIWGRIS